MASTSHVLIERKCWYYCAVTAVGEWHRIEDELTGGCYSLSELCFKTSSSERFVATRFWSSCCKNWQSFCTSLWRESERVDSATWSLQAMVGWGERPVCTIGSTLILPWLILTWTYGCRRVPYQEKHAVQQASLLGNMEAFGLLENASASAKQRAIVELGAGRGYLSQMLSDCYTVHKVVMVERRAYKFKVLITSICFSCPHTVFSCTKTLVCLHRQIELWGSLRD